MNTTRGLGVLAALASTLVLAGCKSSYQADVTNDTDRPIEALLVYQNGSEQLKKFIGPNDRAVVGPMSGKSVMLIVQEPGAPGTAETMALAGGTTAVTVQRMGPRGALVISETRRP